MASGGEKRFLDFLRARPSKAWLLSFSRRRETHTSERTLRVPFVRKIDFQALLNYSKRWIKSPLNVALLIWLAACAAAFLLMGLISVGLLNGTIPDGGKRKDWVEGCNQILNALFTLMCVYQYPKLFYQLVLACRWTADDAAGLRRAYSKQGLARPRERLHIAFVVLLLHLTCFAQFAICGLFWAYTRSSRPGDLVTAFLAVGIVCPIIAAFYTLWGPLGRKMEGPPDEESQTQKVEEGEERRKRVVVEKAEWVGGVFDCGDDIAVGFLSFFCTFCVFGWNMERLGFGNMYVHMFTFVFLVATPVWVFAVTGLQIDDHGVREGVAIVGVLLCFLGFLYGGFWRIQMRKKFKLPANYFWGNPNLADCLQWLFCWSCSLSQEVRTANFYDIEEGSFYSKNSASLGEEEEEEEKEKPELKPLPREEMTNVMAPPVAPRIEQPCSDTKVDGIQNHGV